jgi:putative Mn2+ efflux pump MntP
MKNIETSLILGVQLVGSAGTTWLTFVKDWSGAATFIIMFVVGLILRVAKFKQDYRHDEEEHVIKIEKLRKDSDLKDD